MAPFFVAVLREKIRNCVTLKSIGHALCGAGGTMMEDALPRIRIVAAGASVLLVLTVTLGTASAQSPTEGSAGKPLPLMQFIHPKSKAKPRPHHRLAAHIVKKAHVAKKRTVRQRIAKRTFAKQHEDIVDAMPTQAPAAAAPPENIWPAANTAAPGEMAGLPADHAPTPVATERDTDTSPDQIVIGGHSVQAALPNGLNPTSAAATDAKQAAKTPVASAAPPNPVVHAMVVKAAAASVSSSPVGSSSWIAHVLAALGGSLTAGAVAWFLIRPAPGRSYG